MTNDRDEPQMLLAKEWADTLDRARTDVAEGRIVEIDIDALCDEIDAEADAMERYNHRPRTPSPA